MGDPIDYGAADDATAAALPATIAKARAGDIHAKRRLLEIFCAVVDAGRIPYPGLLAYLSRHFGDALTGKEGAKTLGRALLGASVKGGRSRSLDNDQRDEVLALAVHNGKKGRPGAPDPEIFAEVAEAAHCTQEVVAHAWQRLKDADFLDDELPSPAPFSAEVDGIER